MSALAPGVMVSALVALAAQFLSEHYGAPAMLMALLLGLSLAFLGEEGSRTEAGIALTARQVLRLGVALLGARVSVEMVASLGAARVGLVLAGVALTIGFGLLLARLVGLPARLAMLTAGAVAICGASAALAISAALPKGKDDARDLSFTVLGVTLLSTLAMIFYPMLAHRLGLGPQEAGFFFGATIHDVAQVVGAGFSVSPEAGETATLVKLIRVAALAPVVLLVTLASRAQVSGPRPPLLPGFVLGFLALAALNSAGLIPPALSQALGQVSRWALVMAVAAVGMKTNLRALATVGPGAIALLVAETAFLAGFALLALP